MELDFSKLNKIAFSEFSDAPPEKPPSTMPPEQFLTQGEYKDTTERGNAVEWHTEGLGALQRKADQNRAEKEQTLEVYRTYQENTKQSGQLQTEILKGVQRGESIYTLFLKACKAISLMTSNPYFYTQLQEDTIAIYGAGLLEPEPLKMELEAVEGRLQKLRDAQAKGAAGSPQNIARAIQAHEQRAGELRELITRGGESGTA